MHEMSIGTEAEPLLGKHFDTQVKSPLLVPPLNLLVIVKCPSWWHSKGSFFKGEAGRFYENAYGSVKTL
jgi:hypothetical protein